MPEVISKLLEKLRNFWADLNKGQKIRIFISAGVLLAAIVIAVALTTRVEYVPLFDSADDVNFQPVVEYLNENNIKFRKGTNQIFVDSRKKKDIEFDLTTKGIVSPSVTFADTWSKLSLTATEADKENLWKHYLTNDLVYKLKKFENVINATVQYSKPEKTYWVKSAQEDQQGSAYVMLETKSPLTPDQVDAAAMVVASSLGIPADKITIVDENLNPLNRSGDENLVRAGTQDEMRRQRQRELEEKIYDFFKIGIVENENFDTLSVSANAVLDFDTLKSSSVKYTAPDEDGEGFTVSRETLEENITNAEAGSIPGTDTNPQGAPSYQIDGEGNSQYDKIHQVEEKLFNETSEQSEKAVGKLIAEQSTMSIFLWYGNRIKSSEGLTPEYIDEVKQSASTATGIPVQNISVSIQKLAPKEPVVETTTDIMLKLLDKYGFYVLMLIMLIVMIIVAVSGKKPAPQGVGAAAFEAAAAGVIGMASDETEEIKDISTAEESEIKKRIDRFAQQNPDSVAQLLRNWLADDWE
jgi:flagellar M-ring protein FliF